MPQWSIAQYQGDQHFELLICSPAAQRELVEATRQLDIATNGLTRVVDAEADEGDLEAVTEKAQGI
ncbi:hypothetical protein D3C71_2074990 [compost metagenome]